jgi:hypothetical protein
MGPSGRAGYALAFRRARSIGRRDELVSRPHNENDRNLTDTVERGEGLVTTTHDTSAPRTCARCVASSHLAVRLAQSMPRGSF